MTQQTDRAEGVTGRQLASTRIKALGDMKLPLVAQMMLGEIYADVRELERNTLPKQVSEPSEAMRADRDLSGRAAAYAFFEADTKLKALVEDIRARMSVADVEGRAVLHVFDDCAEAALKAMEQANG